MLSGIEIFIFFLFLTTLTLILIFQRMNGYCRWSVCICTESQHKFGWFLHWNRDSKGKNPEKDRKQTQLSLLFSSSKKTTDLESKTKTMEYSLGWSFTMIKKNCVCLTHFIFSLFLPDGHTS